MALLFDSAASRFAMAGAILVGFTVCTFLFGNYSDYLSLIPPLTVMTDRAKTKQHRTRMKKLKKKDPEKWKSIKKSIATTKPYRDPGQVLFEKREKARRERMMKYYNMYKPYIPFNLDMKARDIQACLKLGGYAFLGYYATYYFFVWVFAPLMGFRRKGPALRPPLPGE